MARRPQRQAQVAWYGDTFLEIVKKHSEDALFAAGEILRREAAQRAPRGRSGNLARSGYVATSRRSTYVRRAYWRKEKRPAAGGAVVAFSAPHAHLMESGRRKTGTIAPRAKRGKGAALKVGDQYRSRSKFRRMSARPFLGPAIDDTQTTMVDELAKVLNRSLESDMPKGKR